MLSFRFIQGAAAYFDGDQKSFFDKYGDQFFYGSMLLGSLMSLLAGAWKFMTKDPEGEEDKRPPMRLYALTNRINEARSDAKLVEVEQAIDEILKRELERYSPATSMPGRRVR